MSQTAYRVVSGTACILSLTSVIGSGYLLRTWYRKKDTEKNEDKLLDEYIAYMSLPELLFALLFFIFYTNPTMNWHWMSEIPSNICILLGAFNQFLCISTTTLNFGLSLFIFLPIINGTSIRIIEQRKFIHLILVFCISLVCTIIPFFGNHYGLCDDGANKYNLASYTCWINDKNASYYLCLYLPAAIYVLFAFCLMIYSRFMTNNEYYKTLIDQLTWYTIAFIFVWFAGILERIHNTIMGTTTPFWLLSTRIICEASIGTVRAIIWRRYLTKEEKQPHDINVNNDFNNILLINEDQNQ
eukprot:543194_1